MSIPDPAQISVAERAKIARRANRKIGSEVSLILSAGFAGLMLVLFVFGKFTFIPVAEQISLRPTVVWIALAVILSSFWAAAHYFGASRKIARAREAETAIRRFHTEQKRIETEAKISSMNDRLSL